MEDLSVVLPSLPRLHSVELSNIWQLYGNVLQWLLPQKESQNATGLGSTENSAQSVTKLIAAVNGKLRFRSFLHPGAGESLTCLHLKAVLANSSEELTYLLARTPNLVEWHLENVVYEQLCCFEDRPNLVICRAITKLPRLRSLVLGLTGNVGICLCALAAGVCKDSLRRLDLRECLVVNIRKDVDSCRDDRSGRGFFCSRFSDDVVAEGCELFNDRRLIDRPLDHGDVGFEVLMGVDDMHVDY